MGFAREHLGFDFEINASDVQAYKQFGNSVVVPQFQWVAHAICDRAGDLFDKRMNVAGPLVGRPPRSSVEAAPHPPPRSNDDPAVPDPEATALIRAG
jgi:hypothetical protein